MTAVNIFNYADQQVRVVPLDGESWFVLSDLCSVLELTTPARVAERLDRAGVSQTHISSGGQRRQLTIVNEPNMYEVVIRSDKPQAVAFRRWITGTVLPSIRKTGSYVAPSDSLGQIRALHSAVGTLLEQNEIVTARAVAAEEEADAFKGADGLPVRNFIRKYFSDCRESDIFNTLYAKHLLIHDPRGRWSEKQQKWIPGKTHMHPYAIGKQYFYLAEELDRDKNPHLKTRVRRDAELALIGYLETQGFTSNRRTSALHRVAVSS